MFRGVSDAISAAFFVLVTVAVLAGVTITIDALGKPLLFDAYSHRYNFLPGQFFVEKLAVVRDDPAHTCIVIGDSKAREGFDAERLRQITGTKFTNAATTGGNNEVVEVQAAVMRHFSLRPKCIVVGISRWMMFAKGSPDLISEEYIGVLGWKEVAGLASHPFISKQGPAVALTLILPLRAQARQLNRILRAGLQHLRAQTLGALPLSRYELFTDELKPHADFLYEGIASILQTKRDKLIEQTKPWYDPNRYGGKQQQLSLRNALDEMLQLSERVILVDMPSTVVMDPASLLGEQYVKRVLADYSDRIELIDCSGLRDEDLFVDEGHLAAEGRRILSQEVGEMLRIGRAAQSTSHCSRGALRPLH